MNKEARVLDSVIGSETECETFFENQLEKHNKMLKKTWQDRKTLPQNVYSCYAKGYKRKNYRFKLKLMILIY